MGTKKNKTSFAPGKSGNPKGRPRIPADIVAIKEMGDQQVTRIFNHALFLNMDEINALVKSKDAPAALVGAAKIVQKIGKYGDIFAYNFLLDRLIGRSREMITRDVTATVELQHAPIRTFEQFCAEAGYFIPYGKQEEMRAFGIDCEETRLLLGARGYGKTDFVTIMGVAYSLYLTWKKKLDPADNTNLIITKSKARNKAIMLEIGAALEKNNVPMEKANSDVIRLEGLIGQDHSVEAITIKSSMRGRHPKRIIMDDPVTDEDVSEKMRQTVKRRYDEAYKLCKNILIIGQPAHAFDLYAQLRTMIKTMLVPHGNIPELDADLDAMLLAGVDPVSIEMSYKLTVPKDGAAAFGELKFIDSFVPGDSVAFIDPSDGGDFTALSIFKGYMDGIAVVGEAYQRAWYLCKDEMYKLMVAKGVRRVCFETNCTGTQPLDQLREDLAQYGIGVVGKHSNSNKESRIMSAGQYCSVIHLSRESNRAYTDQVTMWTASSKYDDGPDSMATGLEWMGLIRGKK